MWSCKEACYSDIAYAWTDIQYLTVYLQSWANYWLKCNSVANYKLVCKLIYRTTLVYLEMQA